MNRAATVVPIVLVVTILGATGQSLLKHAINRLPAGSTVAGVVLHMLSSWQFWAGGVVVTVGFLTWLYALGHADLSYATPFLSFGFITTMIASTIFLHEQISPSRALGTAIIVAGMLLVAKS
jgi:drug/metabolite transporter (DMT)-like permease